jgi:inorganic pyrophosphatase
MEIEVVVEVPKGSRNKYEFDHRTGVIRLDRDLSLAMRFPADYGFIEGTMADDGDPLDALVILEEPTFPGCRVGCRPIGLILMEDEKGRDAKVLSVPTWDERDDASQLTRRFIESIRHFFDVYKATEPGRYTRVGHWEGRAAAEAEIQRARARRAAAVRDR